MSNIKSINLTIGLGDTHSDIHPTVIWDHHDLILVDTGTPNQLQCIQDEFEKIGLSLKEITKIIITHQDFDHIGSLRDVINHVPHPVEIYAHKKEQPYIEGDKTLMKLTPERLPQFLSMFPEKFRKSIAQSRQQFNVSVPVNETIGEGDEFSYCGGITIIETPGHTPGHISLYHQPSKTLVTGDAVCIIDGQLQLAASETTIDMDEAKSSIEKLTHYDIETIICYHGGVMNQNVNEQLALLAK